jgi:hypothetical protein
MTCRDLIENEKDKVNYALINRIQLADKANSFIKNGFVKMVFKKE